MEAREIERIPTLRGVVPMLVTPFHATGRLDEQSLLRLTDHVLASGVGGVAVCGLAGETHMLTDTERRRIVELVLERVGGRLLTLVTATAESTPLAVDLARHARSHGASAIMLAPPRLTRTGPEGLARHYGAVAEAVDLPLMIQDAPEYLGVSLGASLVARLAREYANILYVKTEGLPTGATIAELRDHVGERLGIFSGNGGLYLMDTLRAGAIGTIPGCDVPELLVAIYQAYAQGRTAEAEAKFRRVLPLLVYRMQSLDACIASQKAVLAHRGIIDWAGLRPPGFTLDGRSEAELVELYEGVHQASCDQAMW